MTDRSTRLPTEAEIAEINARHLVETPLRPADLLFVFGTREDVDERVDEACRLWREGYFRWAIVSGGITPGSELSECEIITAAMIARGVPADIILREDRAMNTGENVIFSLPIIDAALGLAQYPQRDLSRQYLDRAPLSDDAASALAGSGEDAGHGRQFRDAAGALAHRCRILAAACSLNGTRSSRTRRRALSRSGRCGETARADSSIRSYRNLLSSSAFPPASAGQHRAVRCCGAASARRTALGAWPGLTAKVVEGVNAMSRRAAAATKVCERQCGGSVSQR